GLGAVCDRNHSLRESRCRPAYASQGVVEKSPLRGCEWLCIAGGRGNEPRHGHVAAIGASWRKIRS
ncbi:MAG: hypothetical protein K2L28_06150, partial [Muribaculaceae bacterium]|nr:hypothetical protein [Muribaculaceae bacterium]